MMDDAKRWETQEQINTRNSAANKLGIKATVFLISMVLVLIVWFGVHVIVGHGCNTIPAPAADVAQAGDGS